jgi:hypothetical protein
MRARDNDSAIVGNLTVLHGWLAPTAQVTLPN